MCTKVRLRRKLRKKPLMRRLRMKKVKAVRYRRKGLCQRLQRQRRQILTGKVKQLLQKCSQKNRQTHGRMWHRKLRQRRKTSRLYWRRRTSWTAGKSRSFRGQLTVQGSLQLQEQGITAIRAKCSLMTAEAHLGISVVKKLLPQKSMFPL